MLVKNPKYESYEEIKKKYDGYCVCIIRCKGDTFRPEGGEVVAYSKDLAELTIETDDIVEDDASGAVTFKTFTTFSDYGVIQVVPYDRD